ncbi:MAG: 3-chlorobenzoate-3,4-dioxygenase dehydrogenase [Planctomycetaceae bacterium]|nr:MAG: 3-chlorobenzoate-3,4-dioxygenase dehydrogenase [Planctomycetaceae bacterium]
MQKQYRVGVIGSTGRGNYGHGLDVVWRDHPRTRVVAVADDDPQGLERARERLQASADYADYRQMLKQESLDLVAIAPRWIDRHAEMALCALEHHCAIYMEKPFVRDLREADAVVTACDMRHLCVALAHQSRYSPVVHRVRDMLQAGMIGELIEMRGRGKEDRRGGGEDLWVLGSHILDLMRFFAGNPQECSAMVLVRGQRAQHNDIVSGPEGLGALIGDAVHTVFRFPQGVMGFFDSVRNAGQNSPRFTLQLLGTRGVIEVVPGYLEPAWWLDDPSWGTSRSRQRWIAITSAGPDQPEPLSGRGLHAGNLAAVDDLLQALEQRRLPLCSHLDGRAVVEMILAVFASHIRGGIAVELPLTQREHPLHHWIHLTN